jgi:hypothetical protein
MSTTWKSDCTKSQDILHLQADVEVGVCGRSSTGAVATRHPCHGNALSVPLRRHKPIMVV